jgi:SAM-dependent methyltransferase
MWALLIVQHFAMEGGVVQAESGLVRKQFEDIYSHGGWGGLGSGPGSLPHNARPYVEYVANLLQRHTVRTVVDVGCGDWQMWPSGTFDGIDKYLGVDIVESVIENNKAAFPASRYGFRTGDATSMTLPKGDLLLCKEVLQHLPNADVFGFLEDAVRACRIVVVCDDIWIGSSSRWRRGARRLLSLIASPPVRVNQDIEPRGYRPVDYSLAPFASLPLRKRLLYESFTSPRCRTIKAIWSTERVEAV